MSSKTVFFFSSLWLCWLEDRRCLCYNLSVGVNNRSGDVRCIQTKFTRDNHLVNQFCHQRLCKKMYFELVDQPGHKSIVQLKMKFYVWCFIWEGMAGRGGNSDRPDLSSCGSPEYFRLDGGERTILSIQQIFFFCQPCPSLHQWVIVLKFLSKMSS